MPTTKPFDAGVPPRHYTQQINQQSERNFEIFLNRKIIAYSKIVYN
jgi:hypothetical protein